jgi:hypothetical protein
LCYFFLSVMISACYKFWNIENLQMRNNFQIKVHDVSRQETTATFSNHMGRVKRLEVAKDCPNLLWSASEDGTVM